VKQRTFAFIPADNGSDRKRTVIKDMEIYAATISTTTDIVPRFDGDVTTAMDNVIDNVHFRYLFHTTEVDGDPHKYWMQNSGLILQGNRNIVKNCRFDYSACSAISIFGIGNKVLNSEFFQINYLVNEAGVINNGHWARSYNVEIAYNYFENCTHKAIALARLNATVHDKDHIGMSRIHHNYVDGFCLYANDCGAFNASASRDWEWVRQDHNIITNDGNSKTTGAIYFDFGGDYLVDHNVIWDVESAILTNYYTNNPWGYSYQGDMWFYNNVTFGEDGMYVTDVGKVGDGFVAKNNFIENFANYNNGNGLYGGEELESNIIGSLSSLSSNFVNASGGNFRLSSTASDAIDKGVSVAPWDDNICDEMVDIGAYEYNCPQADWYAGTGSNVKSATQATEEAIISRIENLPEEILEIMVYPNPAKDQININILTGKEPGELQVKIYNVQGKLVMQQDQNLNSKLSRLSLNISTLNQGIYILHLHSDNVSVKKRLMILNK
jgi:hypothetical protein